MAEYEIELEQIKQLLGKTCYAILSTANKKGVVSASSMAFVAEGPNVYFQTDRSYEKYQNILENRNVAITINNTYFKGEAEVLGSPLDNDKFVELMKQKHLQTFENYSSLPNQVLIVVKLTEGRIWGIVDKEEQILVLDFVNNSLRKIKCENLKGGF